MKIRIKLANGLEFSGNLTAEQLQRAEASKQFKSANKNGIKYQCCNTHRAIAREYKKSCAVYCRNINRCAEQYHKRVDILSNYVNLLNNLN